MPEFTPREGDVVTLAHGTYPGVAIGQRGTVVHVYPGKSSLEVEFGDNPEEKAITVHVSDVEFHGPKDFKHAGRQALLDELGPVIADAWSEFELIVLRQLVKGKGDHGDLEKFLDKERTPEEDEKHMKTWAGELVEEFADAFFGYPFLFFVREFLSAKKNRKND